ncbi:uncharacterized protein LOC128860710 [Anastrepha ludens]|uniref:uncharacterized protein LOC128860710 n=1 Tax=Anastrepha ludens TaxID=28586 RepID=UPI0023B1D5B9|nr:uncharacterized protein LOC128860710 [Anastrepha ludens]
MEPSTVFLVFHFGATLFLLTQAIPYSPWLPTQRHGPLYEGVKLLIAEAELQAEFIWNETEFQLNESVDAMHEMQALLAAPDHTIEDRLQSMLAAVRPTDVYAHCYHQHELAIATFDRDLLAKRRSCERMLEVNLAALQNQSNSEIRFIRSGAAEARNVLAACNVSALKGDKSDSDPAIVMMCVVGRIAALGQHLLEASENFLDELATVALEGAGAELEHDSCNEFEELHQQFESVYKDIIDCIGRGGI